MVKLDSKTIQKMLDVESKLMERVNNARILWDADEDKIYCEVHYDVVSETHAFRLGVAREYFMLEHADVITKEFCELLKGKLLGFFFKTRR